MPSDFASARATSASARGPVTVTPTTTLWAGHVRWSVTEVDATLLCFLVWAWHWADPMSADLPWDRLARVELGPVERAAKRDAVRAFRSQIRPLGPHPEDAPVLPPPVLRRFERDFEVYVLGRRTPR